MPNSEWVVVIQTGPTNDTREPTEAYGPFDSESDAQDWVKHNRPRWHGQPWDSRTLPMAQP